MGGNCGKAFSMFYGWSLYHLLYINAIQEKPKVYKITYFPTTQLALCGHSVLISLNIFVGKAFSRYYYIYVWSLYHSLINAIQKKSIYIYMYKYILKYFPYQHQIIIKYWALCIRVYSFMWTQCTHFIERLRWEGI